MLKRKVKSDQRRDGDQSRSQALYPNLMRSLAAGQGLLCPACSGGITQGYTYQQEGTTGSPLRDLPRSEGDFLPVASGLRLGGGY